LNRDPIGERGGVKLNAFGGNSPLGSFDVLGLAEPDAEPSLPRVWTMASATHELHTYIHLFFNVEHGSSVYNLTGLDDMYSRFSKMMRNDLKDIRTAGGSGYSHMRKIVFIDRDDPIGVGTLIHELSHAYMSIHLAIPFAFNTESQERVAYQLPSVIAGLRKFREIERDLMAGNCGVNERDHGTKWNHGWQGICEQVPGRYSTLVRKYDFMTNEDRTKLSETESVAIYLRLRLSCVPIAEHLNRLAKGAGCRCRFSCLDKTKKGKSKRFHRISLDLPRFLFW